MDCSRSMPGATVIIHWRVNAGLYDVTAYGVQTLIGLDPTTVHLAARVVTATILLVIVGISMQWLKKKEGVPCFGQASLVVIASLFFLRDLLLQPHICPKLMNYLNLPNTF